MPAETEYILTVRDLTVRAGGEALLDHVSFRTPRGITLAIVGPNGAGKTTLLRALLGRIPYTGEISWGRTVRVGYVPQKLVDTEIPLSVGEFLSMKRAGDYASSLATVNLPPATLDRQIGMLSGGEIQRVLIAWATLDRPEVLLFDEPTSNVDVGSEDSIYEAVRTVQREMAATVFLVTHDLHEIHHYADRVLVLDRRVIFEGPVQELFADREQVVETFGLRSEHDLPFEVARAR